MRCLLLGTFEGRTRRRRREIFSMCLFIFFRVSTRISSIPCSILCLRANACIRRFTGHRARVVDGRPRPAELGWPIPFRALPTFPFLAAGAFAPSIRHAPTRIGNQFRETVINGCERSYVTFASLCCLALSATVSRFPPLFFHPHRSFEPVPNRTTHANNIFVSPSSLLLVSSLLTALFFTGPLSARTLRCCPLRCWLLLLADSQYRACTSGTEPAIPAWGQSVSSLMKTETGHVQGGIIAPPPSLLWSTAPFRSKTLRS